ncbi:hypothetical protein [Nocardia sp. NPDC057440]|uniref:hypothetical protein n=1 Tax=Nocardia sp. NPDC057440 TaxID=3346134 RepID=UPI0036706191
MNLKPLRRRLYKLARRIGLRRLAAYLDPGARVRLWDKEWNLIADSDRGDSMPNFETVDYADYGRVVYQPATSVRLGGHRA